jgi:hypothetical protein
MDHTQATVELIKVVVQTHPDKSIKELEEIILSLLKLYQENIP